MANNPLQNKFVAKAYWDFATTNGSGAAETISAHNGPITIPDGAIITNAYYHVGTTVSDNGDDSTQILLGYTGATAAFVAEIAISASGTNGVAGGQFDAGIHGCLTGFAGGLDEGDDAGTALENIASKAVTLAHVSRDGGAEILLTVGSTGVHTLNEGNLTLFVEYVITDDLA